MTTYTVILAAVLVWVIFRTGSDRARIEQLEKHIETLESDLTRDIEDASRYVDRVVASLRRLERLTGNEMTPAEIAAGIANKEDVL